MNEKIPPYLYDKKNSITMILFTALFALLFINLFQPFGSRNWYPGVSDVKYFAFSSLIILTGMLVVVISRVILAYRSKRHSIFYWHYGLWILAEIVAMSIFYTLFAQFFPKDGVIRDISDSFRQSLYNTALVLLLPYAICWLYFSWKEKSALLAHLGQERGVDAATKTMISFHDEKGELKISIVTEHLLYIESADNYTTLHYLNKSKQSHFLLQFIGMQPLIDFTFQELELLPLLVVGDLFLIDPAVDCLLCRPVGEVITKFLQVEPVISIRLFDGRSSDHLLQVVHLSDEVVHCLRDVIEGNRLFIHGK